MIGRRVALINTAPHATHAANGLAATLRTMAVTLVDAASVAITVPRDQDDTMLATNPAIAGPLCDALRTLMRHPSA